MKQQFGQMFLLIPLGLFLLSVAMLLRQFNLISDLSSGLITGVGLGLMLLPFLVRKIKLQSR